MIDASGVDGHPSIEAFGSAVLSAYFVAPGLSRRKKAATIAVM
jgi:hypothetical protein